MVVPVDNRLPLNGRIFSIDGADQFFEHFFSLSVSRNIISRWNYVLNKDYFLSPFRMIIEELVIPLQPVHEPFRVVLPVNRENNFLISKSSFELIDLLIHTRIISGTKLFIVHSNRKQIRFYQAVFIVQEIKVIIYFDEHFHRLDEMLHVFMRMETDKICTHHTCQERCLPIGRQQSQ